MSLKLDNIDRKIVSALLENGRLPAKKLAAELKVHPNTLLQRLRKLEGSGVIKKYSACVDFAKLGYDFHVIILMEVKGYEGKPEQLKDLLEIEEIEALYATTGVYGLVAVCRVKNREHLLDITHKLGRSPIVTRSVTQVVLSPYRTPDRFNPLPSQT